MPSSRGDSIQATPIVFVVDDDISVRESLEALIRFAGWRAEIFASAQDFLAYQRVLAPSCLVLDVSLPGLNGLALQKLVTADRTSMPIIFITGYGDVPTTVQAMKAGAIEFLTKPFRDQDLLDAVNDGLGRDRARREEEDALDELKVRVEGLTPRERTILFQVAEGRLNKQIAGEMGVTETTVKVHRSNMMRKIKASSVAELCRMVDKLKLLPHDSLRS